jgi:hypothetical protein
MSQLFSFRLPRPIGALQRQWTQKECLLLDCLLLAIPLFSPLDSARGDLPLVALELTGFRFAD